MLVPLTDVRLQNAEITSQLREAIERVLGSGSFVLGQHVEQFEQSFARYIGTPYCVGLNSGTSALHLALAALDIGPGDEVITTPHTWISTCWAICYVGATPVFVDIEPATYTLDVDQVERAITPRTKAVIAVHLYGHAARITQLKALAHRYNLRLVEDAAQAHGALVSGKRAGSFGDVGCFSFYPAKNLGALGEAGAVVTDDPAVAARIKRLRDHAQAARHHHTEIGFNARMEAIQAAALNVKLSYLDQWNNMRRSWAQRYREMLANRDDIQLPQAVEPLQHVWHLFVILLPRRLRREHVQQQLDKRGIQTGVHYPTPVPFQPALTSLGYQQGSFPVAEDVMARCLSLPMYPQLKEEQIQFVCQALGEVLSSA